MSKFEDFMLKKNARIDNAAHILLNEIVSVELDGEEKISWNMSIIGELEDDVEKILEKHGLHYCHPFYEGEEEIECPDGKDCPRTDCPLRKKV